MKLPAVFVFFVITLFCVFPLSAQDNKDYSLSLCPQFGFLYGNVEEIVYPTNTKAPLLSQLLWDMKPVFYYGFVLDFSSVKPMEKWKFFSGLSMKFGIPGASGVMEDRDWGSKENTELTAYSSHDNITKEFFLLDFSTGLSFPLRNVLLIKAYINISYMLFGFYGENGSGLYARPLGNGKYASINDNPQEKEFSGTVISYRQEWFYAAPGVSLGFVLRRNYLFEISFMASPVVLCKSLDEHKSTSTQYRDNMKGGVMLEPGLKFSMSITKRIGLSYDVSWRHIKGTRGYSYLRKVNPSEPAGTANDVLLDEESGSGFSLLNMSLLLKVTL
jgi:outer membrane protease